MTNKATAAPAGDAAAQEKARTVEVELSADHFHAGQQRKAGDKIQVTQRQKAFLHDSKKISAVTGTAERVKEA